MADGGVVQTDLERRRQFEAVVDVVYEPLQRYLGRRAQPADVSELLNDSLFVIWRRLDHVPLDDPLPWSYGVAKRCLANHRRGAQRRLRLVGRVIDRAPRDSSVSHPPSLEFDHPQLERALSELNESDQELVRLWAWEHLEPREIAVVLDTTPNTVSLRLTRAKKKMMTSMERQDPAAAGQEGLGHGREPRS
ncbi:MAG: sigma-70 family RNA polymerase sigma factor [Acidimicrobiales bacterium]|nr:MAG: sigma-70 family RNA polymerase sigma factor [Acidimicrobiales bacterium]